ncbi:MAG: hypothetical protein IPI67_26830 [Myxococcales bacterium]|nr:hypothetical protein [Myxococcales bacterium]
MKLRIVRLTLVCKRATETVDFADISYFHGEIGAGKSSIAHLVDYCLGGTLHDTPALQSEFVQAELIVRVGETDVVLVRPQDATTVHAAWHDGDEPFDVNIPARVGGDEVLPGTGVGVLSDLLFHLAGMRVPRVRKSKLKEDSDLVRLSLRDLLWYCYLDQAHMESSLFHLEPTADFSRRLKSRDVLRFVLGFHHEEVATLERELDDLRVRRRATEEGARTLRSALADANLASEAEIDVRLEAIKAESSAVELQAGGLRERTRPAEGHGADALRLRGRRLGEEIEATENAVGTVQKMISDEKRHLNELRMLGVRFRRSDAARALLAGVAFETCPLCSKTLPPRKLGSCGLCCQPDGGEVSLSELDVAEKDAEARQVELLESIQRRTAQLRKFKRDLDELRRAKSTTDRELSEALKQYDSLLMSSLIDLEHKKAALVAEGERLERLRVLPVRVTELLASADALAAEESRVRRELAEAREKAEGDAGNLRLLEDLFKDCLVRAKFPGIGAEHVVKIQAANFYPQIVRPGEEEFIVANHGNLSSGGKVTIFKCCYAIALHRLAARVNGPLPTLLIIDTPMKNISERNNRPIFESFYDMVYDLAGTELKETQFVLIDKEFRVPPESFSRSLKERLMAPTSDAHPPLIGYFRE